MSHQFYPNSYPNMNFVQTKPQIPFFGTIGSISSGSLIIIYGRVPYGSKRFDFNLMNGSVISEELQNSGDIAFHFNPRFDEQLVVRNSRTNQVWGPEERDPKAMPFKAGQPFEAMILVEDSGYKVAVNGMHFIEFCHRMPISRVGIFSIEGNVEIDKIEFRRELRYASATHTIQPSISNVLSPVYNPALPFHHKFGEGLRPGTMVYISGRLNTSPDRFSIDFCCGEQPYSDIAFHFGVRYRESLVVRNTYVDNSWGSEERQIATFPFTAGVNFDMIIRCEHNGFMVAVNGQHFITYSHRIPIHFVKILKVSGDVIIASIRFA